MQNCHGVSIATLFLHIAGKFVKEIKKKNHPPLSLTNVFLVGLFLIYLWPLRNPAWCLAFLFCIPHTANVFPAPPFSIRPVHCSFNQPSAVDPAALSHVGVQSRQC